MTSIAADIISVTNWKLYKMNRNAAHAKWDEVWSYVNCYLSNSDNNHTVNNLTLIKQCKEQGKMHDNSASVSTVSSRYLIHCVTNAGTQVAPATRIKNSYTKYVKLFHTSVFTVQPGKNGQHQDKCTQVHTNQWFCIMVKYANNLLKKLIYWQ